MGAEAGASGEGANATRKATDDCSNGTIDAYGDLRLVVGEGADQRNFLVCSRTLSRVSPVFNAMINGPWTERKPANGSDWIITLPEDYPRGLEIILLASHAHFRLVPKTLSLQELFEVAVVVDKYIMAAVLLPWADAWCGAFDDKAHKPGHEVLLGVGWVFGRHVMVEKVATRLLNHSEVGSGSMVLDGINIMAQPYYPFLLSTGIIDIILDVRLGKIEAILTAVEEMWTQRNETTVTLCKLLGHETRCSGCSCGRCEKNPKCDRTNACRRTYGEIGVPERCYGANGCRSHLSGHSNQIQISDHDAASCEAIITGSIYIGLQRQKLWPLPAAHEVTRSLTRVQADVGGLASGIRSFPGHEDCSPGKPLTFAVLFAVGEAELVLTEKQITRLKEQAETTGAGNVKEVRENVVSEALLEPVISANPPSDSGSDSD